MQLLHSSMQQKLLLALQGVDLLPPLLMQPDLCHRYSFLSQ
jgi:hypothetical protein